VDEVKGPITQAYAGMNASGKELTQAVCRSAHKLVRQVPPRHTGSDTQLTHPRIARIQMLALRVQSAAYSCLLLVVAKTQSEEQFFDNFVFKEKSSATDQQFWGNVIECTRSIDFESQSSFETVYLGGRFDSRVDPASVSSDRDAAMTLPVRGVLSQYLLRTSSQLLTHSNVKRVFSESRPHSQSQSQLSMLTPSQMIHDGVPGGSRVLKENPRDTFATLSQVIPMLGQNSDCVGADDCNDYELRDGEVQQGLGEPVHGLDDVKIALELNHINKQHCMGTLIRVIQRMHTLFQGRWADCSQQGLVPFWISVCRDKLCDYSALPFRGSQRFPAVHSAGDAVSHQRKNIRLFMMRLLMNQPVASIIAPFMPQGLLKAMIDCCLYDLCGNRYSDGRSEKCEENYHYMIRDFVFCIVDSWPSSFHNSIIDDKEMSFSSSPSSQQDTIEQSAAALLSYLIQHVFTDRNAQDSAVVSDTIRSVCALIKLWVGGVPGKCRGNLVRNGIDLTALVDLISAEDAPSGGAHAKASSRGSTSIRMRLAGLEVLLCLLNSGYPILYVSDSKQETWARSILKQACNGCKYPRKEVSVWSALAVGALLSSAHKTENSLSTCGRLVDGVLTFSIEVENKLNSLFSVKNGGDIVVGCVRAICQQYPPFLSREMLLKLFARFGGLAQKSRTDFLEILCTCTGNDDSKYAGIVVMEHLKPYMPALLNDTSTVSIGRGSAMKKIPMTQVLVIRLISLHATVCVEQNIVPTIVFGSETASNGGISGIMKCVEESSLLEVRLEAYNMLMALHTAIAIAIDNGSSTVAVTRVKWLLGVVRILLLRGLTDSDDRGMISGSEHQREIGIRRKIFNFFEANFGLSMCPILRLKTLMSELFDPIGAILTVAEFAGGFEEMMFPLSVSDEWLRYCSYLLLATCRVDNTVGLPCKLFPHGLAPENSYKPMQVMTIVVML
jgi:hypothetical protein